MNILSLFDGMSCGQIALKELGVKVKNYYASEIDKYAIEQTKYNFPNTIHLGDITKIKACDLPPIDLIIGGSPCQGFSFAGKQLNFDDPRSALFFEFVRLLKEAREINPGVNFLLENVRMRKEYEGVISEILGVQPVMINSALVSAQNRVRLYWSDIKVKEVGLFKEMHSDIDQPEDRGVLIKDILQPEMDVDRKFTIERPKPGFKGMDIHGKSNNIRIGGRSSQTKKHNFDIVNVGERVDKKYYLNRNTTERMMKNLRDTNDKAQSLLASSYKGAQANGMTLVKGVSCVALRIPEATAKGYAEIYPGECVDLEHPNSKTRRGRKMDTKSNCLMAAQNSFTRYTEDFRLRRLTPLECSRLQTIPAWYKWNCSDTQAYKMLGNGWTVEVIKHIFKPLLEIQNNKQKNESSNNIK